MDHLKVSVPGCGLAYRETLMVNVISHTCASASQNVCCVKIPLSWDRCHFEEVEQYNKYTLYKPAGVNLKYLLNYQQICLFVYFGSYVMTANLASVFPSVERCRSHSRDIFWFQDGCRTLPKGYAAVYQRSAGWRPGNLAQKTSRTGSLPHIKCV